MSVLWGGRTAAWRSEARHAEGVGAQFALGGVAGGLFASLQSYITPDAFTFEMSVLFFIAILIGGRGSILGPVLGTIILTALPEFAAPLVQWSTFLYAFLLLVIVLLPANIKRNSGWLLTRCVITGPIPRWFAL